MIATLTRLFKGKAAPGKGAKAVPSLKDLQVIRSALLQTVADCDGISVHRLRHKIEQTQTVQDLWLLRNDAYQLISQATSQTIAAERINALLAVFEGWVDARQLGRIR
ncbi:hypothetical protein [Hydrogenophaga luteola]|uniref:Integrase n=1 Tax=Hydrogenophaga luteola TaxID=1591122 RepID=A0ABV7W5A5_9BURK